MNQDERRRNWWPPSWYKEGLWYKISFLTLLRIASMSHVTTPNRTTEKHERVGSDVCPQARIEISRGLLPAYMQTAAGFLAGVDPLAAGFVRRSRKFARGTHRTFWSSDGLSFPVMATNRHLATRIRLLLYPQDRTFRGPCWTSVVDPKRSFGRRSSKARSDASSNAGIVFDLL